MSQSLDHCPSVDHWRRFLSGELNARDESGCQDHLNVCETCCERLSSLSDDELFDFRGAAEPGNRPTLEEYLASRSAGHESALPDLDHYSVIGEVGHGAAGTVYRALQTHPFEREVAIKVIDSAFRGSEFQRRFRREANTLASLNHPSIASLFDAGTLPDGRAFLVMEFVNGPMLVEYCRWSRLPLDERLRLLEECCRAADYAHSQGIIHRDLKPANILAGGPDGEPRVKIIDFGLAKIQVDDPDADLTHTKPGTVQGTYRYMSPEQARGEISSKLDPRTDVYSLGIIAFELVTGVTPLALTLPDLNRDTKEIVDAICEGSIPAPSQTVASRTDDSMDRHVESLRCTREQLRRQLSGDLDWIIRKATEKNREDRYASAAEMADDLQRFRLEQPVLAGPPTLRYRAKKFYRRHRQLTWFVGAVATVLTLGIIGTTAGFMQAKASQRQTSRLATQEAEARAKAEAAQAEERAARIDAEKRSAYLKSSAQMLQTIVDGMSPEFAQANAADLRSSVIEKLKQVGDELVSLPVAEGDDQLVLQASLARALSAFGEYDRATVLWKSITETMSQTASEDSLDFLVAYLNLADAYVDAEKLDLAWQAANYAHELAEKHHAGNQPIVLFALLVVANAEHKLGKTNSALAKMKAVKSGLEAVGMKSTPMWADCVGALAPVQIDAEQYEDAIDSCRQALAYLDQIGAEESIPMRLNTSQNLAIALNRAGRQDEAWQTISELAPIAERHLPAGSNIKNEFEHNLAIQMALQPDRRDEAKRLMRRLAKEAQPLIALRARIDSNKFDFMDGDQSQREAAIEKARALLEEATQSLGEDHPITRIAREGLAKMLND